MVTTRKMYAKFIADAMIPLTFDVSAGPPSCRMEFDSTASKQGNFSSPAYPNNYPENMECYYTFKGKKTMNISVNLI